MNHWKVILAFIASLWVFAPLSAQDIPAVISAENITRLQSVKHIDFADLPDEAGTVDKGWFAMSADANHFAFLNRDNSIVFWDSENGYSGVSTAICGDDDQPGTLVDGNFRAEDDNDFIAVYTQGSTAYFGFHAFGEDYVVKYCRLPYLPLRVWTTGETTWAEMLPQDPAQQPQVTYFPLLYGLSPDTKWNRRSLPSGPETDPESYVRIGRIDPPLAVTVTRDGLVKRWNLETGDVTANVQLDELPGAGQITADGHYFAWRDGESKVLHLFDFENGTDRVITSLNGVFLPFIALSPAADVIIAVNADLQPVLTAWNTATGERYDLGEYSPCNRQPDMVRLSGDGTTLVIGCDSGLDIWQIALSD